jgi:outer membrane lipoprotein-sorting protein
MVLEDRERHQEPAPLSNRVPDDFGPGPAAEAATPEDERIAAALAIGLGRLREARPGYQDELEARLLVRLTEPARPCWRRALPAHSQTRRSRSGGVRMPRRSFVGLAAASALALAGASLTLPLVGTPEVSAREILEKVQATTENPIRSGVKSFHLTAKIWNSHRLKGRDDGPREMTTEQWFVAPDRMRTESRTRDASGKEVVSGFMVNGDNAKHYSTDGANDVFMFGIVAAPIAAKPAGATAEARPEASPSTGHSVGAFTAAVGANSSAQGSSVTASAIRTWPPDMSDGKPVGVRVAVAKKPDEGEGNGEEIKSQVVVIDGNCPEPKRTGEATVAGRPVFVVENDLSSCLPADAPAELRGRHVRWVDQKTFLPLKLEMYGQDGKLVDRYEVTSIEYDVDIAAKTFTEIPAGTTAREANMPPAPPPGDGSGPAVPATKRPTP